MAVRKFRAKTMAEAMRQVRDAVGADAMILQTLKRHGQVELYVEEQVQADELPTEAMTQADDQHVGADPARAQCSDRYSDQYSNQYSEQGSEQGSVQDGAAPAATQAHLSGVDDDVLAEFKRARMRMLEAMQQADATLVRDAEVAQHQAANAAARERDLDPLDFSSFDTLLESIKAEVPSSPLTRSMGGQAAPPGPSKFDINQMLSRLHLGPETAAGLRDCQRLDEFIAAFGSLIRTVEDTSMPKGIKAFVGPAGSGKTTTLTKLVTRQVMQFGAESVAIIGCDRLRAGAQQQLSTVARLLDVPFMQISSQLSLRQALVKVSHRPLVVIDMPGISMTDPKLAESLQSLNGTGFLVRRYLTLPANLQADVLRRAARLYGDDQHTQVILTKLDECCNLGPALNLLAESALPLAYTTDGPHVPEDLAAARALPLVRRALALLRGEVAKGDGKDFTYRGSAAVEAGQ